MSEKSFDSFSQVRASLDDLFRVRPVLYWVDFLSCLVLGWGSFAFAVQTPWSAWLAKVAWLLLSAFALFRALIFMHEMVHIRRGDLAGFRWAWNLLCGMPLFTPDYTYIAHSFHHRSATFSTKDDPEYLPLACQGLPELFVPFLIFPLVPFILAIRYLIVGPLSLIVGGQSRDWVLRYASTFKMNLFFEWKAITSEIQHIAAIQDLLCLGLWGGLLGWVWTHGEMRILIDWYVLTYLMLVINHMRSLARHRYTNGSGGAVSFEDQLLDSVTIHGFSPLASLCMPVGLRWHSIHHMFPTLPYHALPSAHERLTRSLPAQHLYFKTLESSFTRALINFFRSVR